MLPPPLARLKGHLTAALTLLALAAPPRAARAEHGGPWIVITPQAEALPINEQIALISFNGCHDYIDPAFLRDAQPALVSDQDRAPLRLTHQHCDEDGYGRGVALFAPSKPLLLNVTYRLELLDAPPWDAPNAARPRVTLRSWRTAPAAALASPRWRGAPRVGELEALPTVVVPVEEARRPLHLLIDAKPIGGGAARALTATIWPEARITDEPDCAIVYLVGAPREITRPLSLTFTALNTLGEAVKAPGEGLPFTALTQASPEMLTDDLGTLLLQVCVGEAEAPASRPASRPTARPTSP